MPCTDEGDGVSLPMSLAWLQLEPYIWSKTGLCGLSKRGEVVAVGLRDGVGSFPPHKLMSCHAELFQVLLAHEKFVKPERHARERFGTVSAQASAS